MLRTRPDDVARRVAERLEAHQVTQPIMTLLGAKQATSMVAALFPLIIEALDGGNNVRQSYLDMVVPTSASQTEVPVIVHESYRMWMYLLPDLVGRLPESFQGPAAAWLADFVSDWMRTVEARALVEQARLGM